MEIYKGTHGYRVSGLNEDQQDKLSRYFMIGVNMESFNNDNFGKPEDVDTRINGVLLGNGNFGISYPKAAYTDKKLKNEIDKLIEKQFKENTGESFFNNKTNGETDIDINKKDREEFNENSKEDFTDDENAISFNPDAPEGERFVNIEKEKEQGSKEDWREKTQNDLHKRYPKDEPAYKKDTNKDWWDRMSQEQKAAYRAKHKRTRKQGMYTVESLFIIESGKIPGIPDGTGPHGMGKQKGRKLGPCVKEDEKDTSIEEIKKESIFEKTAGTELWQTPEGQWWLLGTVMMEPVSPMFNSKKEALQYAVKNGIWSEEAATRSQSMEPDGVGTPGKLEKNSDVRSFSMEDINAAAEPDTKPEIKEVEPSRGTNLNEKNEPYVMPYSFEIYVDDGGDIKTGWVLGAESKEDALEMVKQKFPNMSDVINLYGANYNPGDLEESEHNTVLRKDKNKVEQGSDIGFNKDAPIGERFSGGSEKSYQQGRKYKGQQAEYYMDEKGKRRYKKHSTMHETIKKIALENLEVDGMNLTELVERIKEQLLMQGYEQKSINEYRDEIETISREVSNEMPTELFSAELALPTYSQPLNQEDTGRRQLLVNTAKLQDRLVEAYTGLRKDIFKAAMIDENCIMKQSFTEIDDNGNPVTGEVEWKASLVSPTKNRKLSITFKTQIKDRKVVLPAYFETNGKRYPFTVEAIQKAVGIGPVETKGAPGANLAFDRSDAVLPTGTYRKAAW